MTSPKERRLRTVAAVTLSVSTLGVSGCGMFFGPDGYFRDRGDDYLSAEPIAPVKLPDTVKGDNIGQLFVIPPIADPNAPMPIEYEVPRPTDNSSASEARNTVKIQKLGERRWIAINAAPSAVWPRVREFLSERNLSLSVLDPGVGVLETDWLSVKDDPSSKDRYRIRLEQGLRNDTTEVHVLQMTVSQAVPGNGQVNWPEQSVNPQRETWMVNELSGYLAKDNTMQASMLAQAIGSSERKVELVSAENTDPYLDIRLDEARAWASVGGAMNHNGFHIESNQREKGYLAVSHSLTRAKAEAAAESGVAEEKPGIFTRIGRAFGFGKNPEKLDDLQGLQVLMVQQDEGMRLTVRSAEGAVLDHHDADKWLRLIRASLL